MDKLLLTGGSGFVGRNIAPLLHGRYRVVTLGRRGSNDIQADLSRGEPSLSGRYDVVVHAAGLAHPDRKTRPYDFIEVNVGGTKRLCQALERTGVPDTFVFVSTVAVYGCDDGAVGVDESWPLDGRTPYAVSKIEAETFLRQWCSDHDVRLAILRPSLLIGPDAPGNMGRMVRGISNGLYAGIGRGSGLRSITLVSDLASVISAVTGRDGVWNVAGEDMSIRQLERLICEKTGRRFLPRIPTVCAKAVALAGNCLGDKFPINTYKYRLLTRSLTFSSAAARRDLGWDPAPISSRLTF